ncbi:FAD:protein FMN transferase [Bremerella cremea]|uniref:FAD:protein FMN transferase n=1 Tax=Blastopirellula marina TaxID=124 RepID=A0A2S8FBI7_9BACT|nr:MULTISPECIES: FAD:protein FMN transferase [Pirellulaceae]PQO29304.1 FAD:protein FMN transferase [Blastopirellula marina]RCS42608.1 FAD:protein FMN transferase [Bremerella cremea]
MTSEEEKRTSRRNFLRGKLASPPDTEAVEGASNEATSAETRPDGAYLVQLARQAMACQFEVYLNAAGPGTEAEGAVAALDLVNDLEQQLSAYRPESEICQLARTAYLGPVVVEPRLFQLLELSLQLHRDTHGAFDITAGPLTKVWGFFDREGKVPQEDDLVEAMRLVGSNQIELDSDKRTLRLAKEGVELNLGSIGKGYALDRCQEVLLDWDVEDFLIHGGTSSVLAHGERRDGARQDGWEVGVPDPLRPDRRIGTVYLKNESLGTSGAAFQAFFHQGKKYGHVLDPRSGRPSTKVLSSTVISPTAALADALATACYVMGPEETEAFLESYPNVSVLLVVEGKRRGSVETIMLGGMSERLLRV